jgi:hypothetical protein
MKLQIIASILFISTTFSPFSQAAAQALPTRTKEVAIIELLNLTGSGNIGVQVINQLLPSFRSSAPEISDEFWDRFSASVNPDELMKLIIPIYAKHFSVDEIERIIAFYKTPTGQKFIREQPVILQESMVAGGEWGQSLAKRLLEEIQAEKSKQRNK